MNLRIEIVQDANRVSLAYKLISDMRADEAGSSSNQNMQNPPLSAMQLLLANNAYHIVRVPKNFLAPWNFRKAPAFSSGRCSRLLYQWSVRMQHEAQTTTDHDTIRKWVEARDGRPAAVAQTHEGDEVGVIRIAFAGKGDKPEGLEDITWDEFFEKFEEKKLAFLYQEKTKDGGTSRFFKLVKR